MKFTTLYRTLIILSLVFINIGCDQVSKSIVRKNIHDNQYIELIRHHFIITKVENTGAFLSLGSTLPPALKNILLLGLPLFVLTLMFALLFIKTKLDKIVVLGLTFIIGGGIGNMIDRMMYGSVTDFLHIDLDFVRTGIFNLADVSVMMGMPCILAYSVMRKRGLTTQ